MKVSYVKDKNGKYHKIEDPEQFSNFSGSVRTQNLGNLFLFFKLGGPQCYTTGDDFSFSHVFDLLV